MSACSLQASTFCSGFVFPPSACLQIHTVFKCFMCQACSVGFSLVSSSEMTLGFGPVQYTVHTVVMLLSHCSFFKCSIAL